MRGVRMKVLDESSANCQRLVQIGEKSAVESRFYPWREAMPDNFRAEACDSRDWVARLAAQPKMLVKVVEMLDLMENARGDLRRADEAERRVTEILRKTGHDVLTGWAGQVAEAVTAEARAVAAVVGHAQKKSTGTRRTGG